MNKEYKNNKWFVRSERKKTDYKINFCVQLLDEKIRQKIKRFDWKRLPFK